MERFDSDACKRIRVTIDVDDFTDVYGCGYGDMETRQLNLLGAILFHGGGYGRFTRGCRQYGRHCPLPIDSARNGKMLLTLYSPCGELKYK